MAYFVEQYGERVLAEPERSGFNSLIWILPVVAVALRAVCGCRCCSGTEDGKQRRESAVRLCTPDVSPKPWQNRT